MGKLGLLLVLVSSLALADKEAPSPTTKPKPVAAQKAVKQMSRPELEQEVENLRAENKKLKADYEAALAKEKDRAARLEKSMGTPAKELK